MSTPQRLRFTVRGVPRLLRLLLLHVLLFHVPLLNMPGSLWAQCQTGEIGLIASRDNTLYENGGGALSNGSGSYLFAGNTNGQGLRRALVHFDVAGGIPAGSTIFGASLRLNMSMTASGSQNVALHPALADWGEGASDAGGMEGGGAPSAANDATWIHTFFTGGFWANSGGDFSPTASATTAVDGLGIYTWGSAVMVADVQSWLDDPVNNFGWAIVGNETTLFTAKRFDSRENTASPNPPTLCVALSTPPSLEIPTLGNFAIIVLILSLIVLSVHGIRRRSE